MEANLLTHKYGLLKIDKVDDMKLIKNFLRKHESIEFFVKIYYFRIHKLLARFISDETFIRMQYRFRTGQKLNLSEPQLYNEKIQWLKLNYKNPLLTKCVDKWAVRDYVKSKGLGEILIPAYGPYESVVEILMDKLPSKFIMKLTNGSSFNIICSDRQQFNYSKAAKYFARWVKIDFFSARREYAYKNVPNRIMCEELLLDKYGNLPSDFRFFCFDGVPKLIAVDLDSVVDGVKTSNYYRHLFTPEWQPVEGRIQYKKKSDYEPEKPVDLEKMLDIARSLSADFPAVRVDLYYVDKRIYFGELTFYHASGYQNISPPSFHCTLGTYLNIEELINDLD